MKELPEPNEWRMKLHVVYEDVLNKQEANFLLPAAIHIRGMIIIIQDYYTKSTKQCNYKNDIAMKVNKGKLLLRLTKH